MILLLSLALISGAQVPDAVDVSAGFNIRPPKTEERRLLDDAADGKLESMDLLTAALIASGVPGEQLDAQKKAVMEALEPAIARAQRLEAPAERGRVLLNALHETVFRRYEAQVTELPAVITTGSFNCLSSATLYAIAGAQLLGQLDAAFTPRHAFLRLTINGRRVDIETTTATGYAPRRDNNSDIERARRLSEDGLKGQSDAAVLAELRDVQELPLLALVAGIYSNRGVSRMEAGDYEGAATAFDRAARIATSKMRERIAGWRAGLLDSAAKSLLERQRPEDARTLLALALEGTGNADRVRVAHNLSVVLMELAHKAARANHPAEAVALAEEAMSLGSKGDDIRDFLSVQRGELASSAGDAKVCVGSAACLARLSLRASQNDRTDVALQHAREAFSLDARALDVKKALFFALAGRAHEEVKRKDCFAAETHAREAAAYARDAERADFDPRKLTGTCFAQSAVAAHEAKLWDQAEELYARAQVLMPEEKAIRHNLAALSLQRAVEAAKALRCDEARGYAARAESAQGAKVTASCFANLAIQRDDQGQHREAVAASRLALQADPDDAALRHNQDVFLQHWMAQLLKQGDCAQARSLLPELSATSHGRVSALLNRSCSLR